MDKLQELKKRIEEVQAKSAVSGEIRAFITLVLKIIKETKDNFDTLSKENLATISEALKYIEQEHEKVINSVSHETKEVKLDFAKQVKELKDLAEQVKAIKPKDGADGKDADEAVIVENVLAKIKLPEYEVFTLEDKGAEIVDEINALPLEDAYKIDASHIKNLPPTIIQGGNISKAVYQLSDVVLTNLTNDEVLKWDATNQVWINGTGGGGGTWGSITGTLSDQTDLQSALDAKQATLVSATNIKTINGNSLLGSGDLVITGTIDGSGTTNELTYWVDSDTVGSLAVATYPSLTELTYIKGVTSAIQTQLNAKASSTAYTLAGVSALSDDATKSLYTMSAGVPVEFESSDNNTLLYLDETNERVGIGTTSPTARTHIVGSGSTSSTTALLVENSIGTDGLVVTGDSYVTVPNGRLGVGTSSPDGRMHIAESIVSGGASAFNSTITIENNDSHGINIISPTSRSGNIYFSDNVASRGQIGYNHNGDYMYFHTAGSERIRIDGAGAVGIGTTTPTAKLDVVGSGSTSATTAFRVANSVGTDALEIKDNGISTFNNRVYQTGLGESTFFGFEAGLNDDLTSNRNSAFGYTALYSNTTGAYNTANGYQSLYSNTTGAYNTANGYEALFSNTTGVYNTANGYQAGRFIADGTTANTTGDYNVFLGADTKALADNDQNEIVIGYNATGLGSNSVVLGNSSIALTRLRGQVGIGTDTPDRLLHAEVSDAVTNAVTYAQRLSHITSGTVAASFGTGTEYELENASNTNRVAGTQEITWSDATDATEDATYTLKLIKAGTLTAGLTVLSTGEATFAGDVSVPDEVYGVGWDASLEVPTKNALYDKIQTLASGTAYTLAGVSALSDDATKSLYTMSAGVPVEFESSDNNTLLYLDETNERVGIGTTAPGAKLEVKSGGTSSYFSNFIPSTGSGFIKIYQDTNSHLSIYGANSAGTTNLVLNTNGVSYLKGGNVLIGSSSDNGNTLQVAGTGYFSGLVGIGTTAPDRLLHAEVSDSGTNSVTYAQRLSHITSGAATTNFGIGVEYELENASGTNRVAGTEEFTWTTATASSESAQYVIQLTRSGTLTDALTLSANAELSTVRYLVEANTAVSASPNIITAAESRKVFTNEGATAQNYHTLPTAVAGLTYTFYVDDADGIRITANTSDIIQINGVASSSAGYAESITIGSSITLTAINSTDWVATSLVGTWNVA